jgi:hypothetical protein
MADWSGYTQGPNWQGLVQSNEKAANAFNAGMDTAFSQGLQKDQNARAWDENSRAWDANTRANNAEGRTQQMFPYQLDDARLQNAVKAQAILNEFGGMAQDAQTEEEYRHLVDNMKQYGINTGIFDSDNWQVGKRRLQMLTGDTNRRLAQEMAKAKIAETQAQAQKLDPYLQAQIEMFKARRVGNLVRGMGGLEQAEMPEMPRFSAGTSAPVSQPAPQQPATAQPQQTPLPSVPGISVQPAAQPNQMPAGLPQTTKPNAAAGSTFAQPAFAPPTQPGDITSSAGAVGEGRGYAPGFDETDAKLAELSMIDPRVAQIVRESPALQYRIERAKNAAKNDAQRTNEQLNAAGPLQLMDEWRKLAEAAGPELLKKAIGPWMNSSEYQKFRQTLPMAERMQWDQAYNLNLRMQHFNHMLNGQMRMLGGGNPTSDAQAATLNEAIGAALRSGNPETFFSVLADATNGVRSMAKMPYGKIPEDIIPPSWRANGYVTKNPPKDWSKPLNAPAAPQGQQPIPAQRSAAPPPAIQLLRENKNNPDVIRQFEQKYGVGSAAAALGNGT